LLFIVSLIIGAYIAVVTILRSGYVAGISLSLLIAPALGVIVAIIWLAIAYSGWESHKLILTTKRVIVTRRSLRFFEDQQEAELSQISHVKITVPEPLAKKLGYAHLIITSPNSQINFTHLAEAKQVKNTIDRARENEVGSSGDNQA
jgi:phosphate/sulfate permease